MFKAEKGITLVALVITIIVLLILAGVSIAAITNQNGIIDNAKDSSAKYDNAADEEDRVLTNYMVNYNTVESELKSK